MIEHKGDSMRVLGYMPLHYGADYFLEACRSVLPAVDKLLILYTKEPSYGHGSDVSIPEKEKEENLLNLFNELKTFPEAYRKSIEWVNVKRQTRESSHREIGNRYAESKNYHLAVSLDSDEIWNTESLLDCLVEAFNSTHRYYRTSSSGWKHFYRSFNEYCEDGFEPVRIFNFSNYGETQGVVKSNKIYHMGYAINPETMWYKLNCHGHKSEIDIDTFFKRWLSYDKAAWDKKLKTSFADGVSNTLHPVSRQVWKYTKITNKNELPQLLKDHEYATRATIR